MQHDSSNGSAAATEADTTDERATRACLTRLARTAHPQMRIEVTCVTNELELLQHLLALVAYWDPDIFAGYEIEMASWGYVLQRAQMLGVNLKAQLSRVPYTQHQPQNNDNRMATATDAADNGATTATTADDDHNAQAAGGYYGVDYVEFEVRLSGRIFLDVWRLLRPEIALTSYTFENCMYHILHRRCPRFSHRELTRLWRRRRSADQSGGNIGATAAQRCTVLEYYVERVLGNLELLNQLDLIGRTCELAKLFGIQFYEVLSRGSQFRVESMMLR